MISQAKRIAERINLPFTLMKFRLHVCQIRLPFAACRTVIKGVGIRININAHPLTVDNACQHFFQCRVFIGQLYIRPYLCSGVTQPHGMNISRIHKGIRTSVFKMPEVNRRIQRIGKTIRKHPDQTRIGQQTLYPPDLCFHCL